MVWVDILALFLILEEKLSVFHHWTWSLLWAFYVQLLLCWENLLLFLALWLFLPWKDITLLVFRWNEGARSPGMWVASRSWSSVSINECNPGLKLLFWLSKAHVELLTYRTVWLILLYYLCCFKPPVLGYFVKSAIEN